MKTQSFPNNIDSRDFSNKSINRLTNARSCDVIVSVN
ncbi:hypothetical protein M6B38_296990 [Iris pallida]|uniref:Uncharacterized protein n=1 Tax=Iris pallida TaxID=29817 RepID=A0AAX6HS42_IRIPA|nr:hypothetical protein M6B38_296990 [Iris pallida]